jgi:3'-phosphoadenosine 5'-phosphosulfate (PAPS) 3'-phosphatase
MCQSLHYNKPWVQKFAKLSAITNLVRMDSMAKFCMIADGSADFYIKPMSLDKSYIWDFLPGDLLVKESGGIVTDLNERPLRYHEEKCLISAPGLVASNGLLQQEILNIIKKNNLLGNL